MIESPYVAVKPLCFDGQRITHVSVGLPNRKRFTTEYTPDSNVV